VFYCALETEELSVMSSGDTTAEAVHWLSICVISKGAKLISEIRRR
jgi:hypothetical protein